MTGTFGWRDERLAHRLRNALKEGIHVQKIIGVGRFQLFHRVSRDEHCLFPPLCLLVFDILIANGGIFGIATDGDRRRFLIVLDEEELSILELRIFRVIHGLN